MEDLINNGFVYDMMNSIQAGVIVYGPDLSIVHRNAYANWLLGISADQLSEKMEKIPDWEFFYTDGSRIPDEQLPVNIVSKSLTPLQETILGIRPASTQFTVWVSLSAKPLLVKQDNSPAL